MSLSLRASPTVKRAIAACSVIVASIVIVAIRVENASSAAAPIPTVSSLSTPHNFPALSLIHI